MILCGKPPQGLDRLQAAAQFDPHDGTAPPDFAAKHPRYAARSTCLFSTMFEARVQVAFYDNGDLLPQALSDLSYGISATSDSCRHAMLTAGSSGQFYIRKALSFRAYREL